jgi:hypothetical protein
MATTPRLGKTQTIQDWKALIALATPAVVKRWATEDKAKGKTGGVNAAFLKAFAADVEKIENALKINLQPVTGREQAARATLRAPLQAIRDDISETFPDDSAVRHAFGVGKDLSRDSTPLLLEAATGTIAAYADYGAKVAAAGVNAKRIAALAPLRAALAAADAQQRETLTDRIQITATQRALFVGLAKRAALLRKRLARSAPTVKGKKGRVRSTVRSTASRHTVKKRPPKPPITPPGPATA